MKDRLNAPLAQPQPRVAGASQPSNFSLIQQQPHWTLSEKLLIYALGRGLDARDMPAVRAIIRDGARRDYRFSSMVLGIVRSTPFTMRVAQQPASVN